MSPPNLVPGTPQEWLARAKGKLALARAPLPQGAFYEDLCFFAQQAAELAIKAVYQQNSWAFAYSHNLGQLLDGLENLGLNIPAEAQQADQLSVYAVQTRYPGVETPVGAEEHDDALKIAEAVIAWAEPIIS